MASITYQDGLDQIDKATQKISDATQITIEAMMNAFLFTWQWWIVLAMIIVPWLSGQYSVTEKILLGYFLQDYF